MNEEGVRLYNGFLLPETAHSCKCFQQEPSTSMPNGHSEVISAIFSTVRSLPELIVA